MRQKSKESCRNKSSTNKSHCSCTKNKHFINISEQVQNKLLLVSIQNVIFTPICFAWIYVLWSMKEQNGVKSITIKEL
jgi:hypothetical protein